MDRLCQKMRLACLYDECRLKILGQEDYTTGYRPNRSAHDALRRCQQRCHEYRCVIDMDIKGFFDNIDHDLMMKVLR